MPEAVRARSVSIDLGQRRIIRAQALPSLVPPPPPPGESVTVNAGTADAVADRRNAGDIVIFDSGETFGFLSNPSLYGYPDETNTGVIGVGNPSLTTVGKIDVRTNDVTENGVVRATRPGSGSTTWGPITLFPTKTVIDLANITPQLRQMSAYLLEVKRSKVTATGAVTGSSTVDSSSKPNPPWAATTLTDCTIYGGNDSKSIAGGNITVLRCDVSGGVDGVILQSAMYVEDSYIHDLSDDPGTAGHEDCFQMVSSGGASAIHCTLLAAAAREPGGSSAMQFPDGWYDPHNSALQMGNLTNTLSNLLLDDCLVDGGNYTINANWTSVDAGTVAAPTNIIIRNLRFGRHARYGPKLNMNRAWITWTNNVWDDTGVAIL